MPNQEPAFSLPFGNGLLRVGTKGLFRPCLKTFLAPFLSTQLTTAGSPRMENVITKVYYKVQWTVITTCDTVVYKLRQYMCVFKGGSHPSLLTLELPLNCPPPTEMTCGFLIQRVFCKKNYVVYWC